MTTELANARPKLDAGYASCMRAGLLIHSTLLPLTGLFHGKRLDGGCNDLRLRHPVACRRFA